MRGIHIRRAATSALTTAALAFGALVTLAAPAHANDEPLPPFGPTSIAVPAEWATNGAPTRLQRNAPAYQPPRAVTVQTAQGTPVQVYGAPIPRRRSYDITTGPWRPRGPVEVRDEWILAQPRMTLPAVSPDAPRHGSWTIGFHIDRGNDFGYDQDGPAETPTDRRFMVDGEHQATELRVRYGWLPRLSVGVRLPVYWRGGGFMDEPIDWFHDLFKGIGFLDNGRPAFRTDQFRANGRTTSGGNWSWDDKRGTALGNIELEAYWHIKKACDRCDWRTAWLWRFALPTGGDPYDSGFDVGTQFVVAKKVGRRMDFYGGLGGTWYSDDTIDGVEYEPFRFYAFGALEFHITACWSLIVETNFGSRMISNIVNYPAESWYVNVSTRYDLSQRWEVYIGFTENLIDQQSTVDFGGFAGLTLKL